MQCSHLLNYPVSFLTEEEPSDLLELEEWASDQRISRSVIRVLYKQGYTSLEALGLLEETDLQDINDGLAAAQKIPLGQQKLLLLRAQEIYDVDDDGETSYHSS